MRKLERKIDSYIFIPCTLENLNKVSNIENERQELFIEKLTHTSEYELNPKAHLGLSRVLLEENDVSYYLIQEKRKKITEKCKIFFTYQPTTKLGVVIICIPNFQKELTVFYDNMTKGKLYINGMEIKLYLSEKYGIRQSGSAHSLTFTNKEFSPDYMCSLLSNEAYMHSVNSKIIDKDLKYAATNNLEVFEFKNLYAFATSIVCVLKNYYNSFEERIFDEVQTVFIVEIIMLQDASLIRVNDEITDQIENTTSLSLKKIEEINFQFAKTIKLWDFNLYIYPLTRKQADIIYKAFNIDKVYGVFLKNKSLLEHIINTHNSIINEKEARILNIVLVVLATTQAAPIVISAYRSLRLDTFELNNYILAITIPFITLVIILLLINRLSNKRRGKK